MDTFFVSSSADTNTYWIFYDAPAAGSRINIPVLEPNFLSVVKNAPLAFINALLRPHFFETKNILMILSAVENAAIVLLLLVVIFFRKKNIEQKWILFFCFSVVVLLFTLSAITTPILGAIVRYKMPAMPFLCIGLLLLWDKEKFLSRFSFLQKFSGKKISTFVT